MCLINYTYIITSKPLTEDFQAGISVIPLFTLLCMLHVFACYFLAQHFTCGAELQIESGPFP
jgi:hypothetical protein